MAWQLDQNIYCGSLLPGSLEHRVISSHDISFVKQSLSDTYALVNYAVTHPDDGFSPVGANAHVLSIGPFVAILFDPQCVNRIFSLLFLFYVIWFLLQHCFLPSHK